MQVDPIKPTLKAPGLKRLKLKCDKLLSTFALKFNLLRYSEAVETANLAETIGSYIEVGSHG